MTERHTPAGRLVAAFGNVETMAKLYAPGIVWTLPVSPVFPEPIRGHEAVIAFNHRVWGEFYDPDCSVEILDEVGDDGASAVRFLYSAFSRLANKPYRNDYTLFARSGPDGITDVFESYDTLTASLLHKKDSPA